MEDNVIKVSVRPNKQNSVKVSSNVVSTPITANSDTSQLWSQVSKNWAISEVLVDNTDYSSKYYANKAKESASNAQGFESSVRDIYNGFLGETTEAIENVQGARDEAIANIETSRVEAIDNITTVKSESIASVEAKSDEILSAANQGIAEINNTKTTILNDIEFVADREKQEINDLADIIKDNADTVNTAIEAGVERLNSIDSLKNNQITNCLLEVPQNIKLELANGVLTLKAGSKVIVPNGAGVFEEVVTTQDKSITYTWNPVNGRQCMVFTNEIGDISNSYMRDISTCLSGPTTPTITNYTWYDTGNNIVRTHLGTQQSLPIAIITQGSDGVTKSIDQVFNGFGYIGSTAWVDKGVKGLIPNGRNEDGTLRNIEYTTPKLITRNWHYESRNQPFFIAIGGLQSSEAYYVSDTEPMSPTNNWIMWYNPRENVMRYSSNNGKWTVYTDWLFTGIYTSSDTTANNYKLTQFTQPKLPFRAVDYNEAVLKSSLTEAQVVVETYVNGTSWYRIWSDRWCEQGGATESGTTHTITFLKPFRDTNYTAVSSCTVWASASRWQGHLERTSNTQMTLASYDAGAKSWYACGYIN